MRSKDMSMDAAAMRERLLPSLADSVAIIRDGIFDYIYGGRPAAYRNVAVELRKLLLDKNAVASFVGRKNTRAPSNLIELAYGNKVYLRSFLPKGGGLEDSESDGWRNSGPSRRVSSEYILVDAHKTENLVLLRDWLSECSVRDNNGTIRGNGVIIEDIAGKDGSHIIDRKPAYWRNGVGFALVPSSINLADVDITKLGYESNWEQFIIDSGVRLLYTLGPDKFTFIFGRFIVELHKQVTEAVASQRIRTTGDFERHDAFRNL